MIWWKWWQNHEQWTWHSTASLFHRMSFLQRHSFAPLSNCLNVLGSFLICQIHKHQIHVEGGLSQREFVVKGGSITYTEKSSSSDYQLTFNHLPTDKACISIFPTHRISLAITLDHILFYFLTLNHLLTDQVDVHPVAIFRLLTTSFSLFKPLLDLSV